MPNGGRLATNIIVNTNAPIADVVAVRICDQIIDIPFVNPEDMAKITAQINQNNKDLNKVYFHLISFLVPFIFTKNQS